MGMETLDRQLPASHLWRNQPRSLSLEDSDVQPQGRRTPQGSGQGGEKLQAQGEKEPESEETGGGGR